MVAWVLILSSVLLEILLLVLLIATGDWGEAAILLGPATLLLLLPPLLWFAPRARRAAGLDPRWEDYRLWEVPSMAKTVERTPRALSGWAIAAAVGGAISASATALLLGWLAGETAVGVIVAAVFGVSGLFWVPILFLIARRTERAGTDQVR